MPDDDKTLARKLAQDDLRNILAFADTLNVPSQAVAYDDSGLDAMPLGDGDRTIISIHIGERGSLTKHDARVAAKAWREATRRCPKGLFFIALLGYDRDPRGIWEIPEAARYVRRWAKYAGMNVYDEADRWLGPGSAIGQSGMPNATAGLSFLAACGVFGDEIKRQALAGFAPTAAH